MSSGPLLGVLFALGWIPMFVFRAEAVTEALPSYTRTERLWVTLTPIALAVHMSSVCVVISLMRAIQPWTAGLALVLFGGAILFWFWGRVLIGPLRVRRLPDEPPLRLQRRGAFGIVRHPLYFAYWLSAAAPLLLAPRPVFLLTFALCTAALMVRAVQEEHRLRAQLGPAYDDYSRNVKRLIPFVW